MAYFKVQTQYHLVRPRKLKYLSGQLVTSPRFKLGTAPPKYTKWMYHLKHHNQILYSNYQVRTHKTGNNSQSSVLQIHQPKQKSF